MEYEHPIVGITPDLLKWIKSLKENYQTHLEDIIRLVIHDIEEEDLNDNRNEDNSDNLNEDNSDNNSDNDLNT